MMRPPGLPHAFHGEQIAVCTVAMARAPGADPRARPAAGAAPDRASTATTSSRTSAPVIGDACWRELEHKRFDAAATDALNARLARDWDAIRARIAAVTVGAAQLRELLADAGAPIEPRELGWSAGAVRRRARARARDPQPLHVPRPRGRQLEPAAEREADRVVTGHRDRLQAGAGSYAGCSIHRPRGRPSRRHRSSSPAHTPSPPRNSAVPSDSCVSLQMPSALASSHDEHEPVGRRCEPTRGAERERAGARASGVPPTQARPEEHPPPTPTSATLLLPPATPPIATPRPRSGTPAEISPAVPGSFGSVAAAGDVGSGASPGACAKAGVEERHHDQTDQAAHAARLLQGTCRR